MKNLFLLLFLTVSISAFAQQGLLAKISGDKQVTGRYTKLNAADRINFNPSDPKGSLGLETNSGMLLLNTETDRLGQVHYRYVQTYKNIPVENSMMIAHVSGGKLSAISGAVITKFNPALAQRSAASLSAPGAVRSAVNYVNANKYAWQDAGMEQRIKMRKGANASFYPVPAQVWYGGDNTDPAALRLAYKVDIYSLQPLGRKFIYVDAQNGTVLGFADEIETTDAVGTAATGYSGTQTIHSNRSGNTYRLRDMTKGYGVITLRASGHTDYTNSSANWSFNSADKWALDAHYGVSSTWTFYKNVFNRNSVDNAGYALTSWVNDTAIVNNAYWDGAEMNYGIRSANGAGVTGIDVTGHELTHGLTQYTCNLMYAQEPGAINESMSDIMGKAVQFYTKPADNSWILSNDIGWEIRSFSNPNADRQPDTYQGTYWSTSASDNYGVHTNSGVGNYMFYLLVNGGSGSNDISNAFNVSGIGLAEAEQIIYRTETVYLTSTSQYTDWRTACINAATDLYGASSNEVIQVQNAWYAVGIGTPGSSSTCVPPLALAAANITDSSALISWAPIPGAAGYTLQYKNASAMSFTTVTGITASSYILSGLTPGSSYQVQVATDCGTSGSSPYGAAIVFTTSGTATIVYCTSTGAKADGITNVAFNTINNTSSSTGYSDYTATQSTTVYTNNTYPISVRLNTGGNKTNYAKAWIDWNHDGVFDTSTEEYDLGTATNTSDGLTTLSSLPVTVPAAAVIGSTRMRVSTQYNATPLPCRASFDGEVEDYSILVAGGAPCGTPATAAASSITNTGAILSWAAVSGATGYNLQYKLSNAFVWTTVSVSANSYTLSGLTAGTAYQFQAAAVCSATNASIYGLPISFTTTSTGIITYCTSAGNTSHEYLKTVVLGSISHTTTNDGGYGNYTSMNTALTAGRSYNIKLGAGFAGSASSESYTVYIDYDQDGLLTGINEMVVRGTTTGTQAKSFSFTVPATAKNGPTRLRVQMHYGLASTNPCAALDYGDTHDYTVTISGGTGLNAPQGFSDINTEIASDRVMTVYPNPVSGSLATVKYTVPQDGKVTVSVVDISGRVLQTEVIGNQTRGTYTYSLRRAGQLVNGSYFVVLLQNNAVIGRNKLVISK